MARQNYSSLSTAGIIKNPTIIAENLFADYLGTNVSQSNIFTLVSMSSAVQKYGSSEVGIRGQVQNDLMSLFGSYFDNVDVTVTTSTVKDQYGEGTESRYNLIMEVWFDADGVRTSLVQALQVENSTIKNIATIEVRK